MGMLGMDKWSAYDAWNEAVLDVLFPELDVPEPVYLDLEEHVIEALSTRMSVEPQIVESELITVVRATLPDGGPASIFERHMARTRQWFRGGRVGTPPYLGLLATFCLAAERMAAGDGMATSNYFGRLREVLGREPTDHRIDQAYRRVAEKLWQEHNRWLVELDGQRGLPTAFALTHRFVGLTVSQALVRSADRERLKDFFRQYGFAPGADVPPSELIHVLDSWMSQRPCPASSGLERLWKRGQAKERIAQAAAVALAAWDGSVRERSGRDGTLTQRGHLALTLEIGGFPRKRFALQALFYLPQPATPRDATVLTATPAASIELVSDLPGALGLGRGSSLHPGDVLEGQLLIEDSLTGQVLERRPRRLVLFREDELSRRWVESPQVMLGDNVRLVAHESLVPRLVDVLTAVARPGWEVAEPYPGQPDGWAVITGVEVFNHPGDLISTQRMDDLVPLIPLTSSQLKVAGGFALPGQVRGKWHSWAPPEVRAVSDSTDGFRVRLTDLNRFGEQVEGIEETVLAEWSDEGRGVLVEQLSGLELTDGDYRIDLLSAAQDDPISSTTVLLRSADTPDQRQWALLETISYGPGIGVLGVEVGAGATEVRGHVVRGGSSLTPPQVNIPSAPSWQKGLSRSRQATAPVVRLTMPDAESCLYTGRHVEDVETVPTDAQGKPLVAWSHGRCKGCGLVRRYPTRLRPSGFGRARTAQRATVQHARHDLSGLSEALSERRPSWAVAFDAVLHTGGGSWAQLERIALQIEPTALFVDQFGRTLEVLGHLDVRRHPETLEAVAWEVAPTALTGTADGVLFSGFWPSGLYSTVGGAVEEVGGSLSVSESSDGPDSYFADMTIGELENLGVLDTGVSVIERAWEDVASVLPPLSQVLQSLPRQSDSLMGDITWFQPRDNAWMPTRDFSSPGAYRVRRFTTIDFVRTEQDVRDSRVARSTVQLGKHLAALMSGQPLIAYDPTTQQLVVPLGADLPGLYGRAVVAASGCPPTPIPSQRLLAYDAVPPELARHIFDLMSR